MLPRIQGVLSRWLHHPELQRWSRIAPSLFACSSLMLLLGVTVYRYNWPYDGIAWSLSTGQVEQVDPQGPAADVLQVGDRIDSWDGIPLDQTTALYLGKRPGDRVTFRLFRGGQEETKVVTLAAPSLSISTSRLQPMFVALAFWLIGILVLILNPTDHTALLFFVFNQVSCAALTLGSLSTTGLLGASQLFSLLLWFLTPLIIHVHLDFPYPKRIPYQRFFLTIIYCYAVVGALLDLIDNLKWIGSINGLSRLSLMGGFLIAVSLLFHTYFGTSSCQVKARIRLVVLGAGIALIPPSMLALLPDGLLGQPLVPYMTIFPFLLVIPLAYGYAIIRHRLIAFDRSINRSLVYLCHFLSLAAFYLLLNTGLERFSPPFLWHQPWISTALALLLATMFVPLRNQLQRTIDWAFYGGSYDYPQAVQHISVALERATNAPALSKDLLDGLRTTLRLQCVCLLLQEQGNFSMQGLYTFCPKYDVHALRLDAQGGISRRLEQEQRLIATDVLRDRLAFFRLDSDEQRLLACEQSRLWIPLAGRDQLLGVRVQDIVNVFDICLGRAGLTTS